MQMTIRIDSNNQYEYAKITLRLIDDVLYIVENGLKSKLSLHLLNDGYILYANTIYSDNVIALLNLIKEQYYNIVQAIKLCEATGKAITDVGYVKGLSVSDW